ncbi:porin [Pseudoruegeria sp. SK021]|uniref:porin n=1 Tax=Pseudoruegeria sp. SK021 TaxID=1933035 RepID=UPI000A2533ED|nr:porin [Pseudoruegeria sp. SK021]OSP56223.1 hypothetical protein BV911_02720 [Pseudoruegeria sp. SK021]
MPLSRQKACQFVVAHGAGIAILSMVTVAAHAESPLSYTFANGGSVTAYGQINPSYLGYDDGEKSQGYAPVGNANSTPRFGAVYESSLDTGWDIMGIAEAGYMPRASNAISQLDSDGTDWGFSRSNLRKLEVSFGNETYGNFSFGQGSMASDGIAEIDVSGTDVIGYSHVSDIAGDFFYRQNNGTLSDITVQSTSTNLDGSRRLRVRYDTPTFSGITVSGAYGNDWVGENPDDLYGDLAARYMSDAGGFQTQAGVGYNWTMPDGGDNFEFWSGSLSTLHKATGLNFTVAGGSEIDSDGDYIYTKLGWKADFWDIGSTNFAVDYYDGQNFAENDSDSITYSVMAVQNIQEYAVDVYAIYRVFTYDDTAANYQDGQAVMAGVRWQF